jgi:transcription initiation factor IIE alpha subunit
MEARNQQSESLGKDKFYQCPMRCEGDKVYEHPGTCPVCNMKLVPVVEIKLPGRHGHK